MAGGLAFIAHPGVFLENREELEELLLERFDGIEVHHPKHTPDIARRLGSIANERGLLTSGGSDFHGFTGRDMPVGALDIPYSVLTAIKRRLGRPA